MSLRQFYNMRHWKRICFFKSWLCVFVFTDVFEVHMYVHMYANNTASVTSLKDVIFEFLDLLIALRNMLQNLVIKKSDQNQKVIQFQLATLLKKRLLYLHVIAINFQMLWNNCHSTRSNHILLQMFSFEFTELFKNIFFIEYFRVIASD